MNKKSIAVVLLLGICIIGYVHVWHHIKPSVSKNLTKETASLQAKKLFAFNVALAGSLERNRPATRVVRAYLLAMQELTPEIAARWIPLSAGQFNRWLMDRFHFYMSEIPRAMPLSNF